MSVDRLVQALSNGIEGTGLLHRHIGKITRNNGDGTFNLYLDGTEAEISNVRSLDLDLYVDDIVQIIRDGSLLIIIGKVHRDQKTLWGRTYVRRASSEQTISHATNTAVAYDEIYLQEGPEPPVWDSTVDATKLTVTKAGIYQVTASARFASGAAGWMYIGISLNGTDRVMSDSRYTSNTTLVMDCHVSGEIPMAIDDWIQILVHHQSDGGSRNLKTEHDGYSTSCQMSWIDFYNPEVETVE